VSPTPLTLARGTYSVLLGTGDAGSFGFTNLNGIPDGVFEPGENRWLGISVNSAAEFGPRTVIAGGSPLAGGGGPALSDVCEDSSDAGALRWNEVQQRLEVCNGSTFNPLSTTDNTPDPFTFGDSNSGLGQQAESSTVTVTGFEDTIVISVSGQGSPELSINGGASWATSASITEGQSLTLRLTGSNVDNEVYVATVTAPNFSTSWSVQARDVVFINQHTGGGQTVYQMEYRTMPPGDLRAWYRDICLAAGLRPVSCNPGVYGSNYNASAWSAVALDQSYWSCNVSSGVSSRTGWQNIITYHVPNADDRGVCQNGCTIDDSVLVAPICTDVP
jgi:hypothetical protein